MRVWGMAKSAFSMNALIFVLTYTPVCACLCLGRHACCHERMRRGLCARSLRSRGEDKPLNVCIVLANELKQNGREQSDEKEKET